MKTFACLLVVLSFLTGCGHEPTPNLVAISYDRNEIPNAEKARCEAAGGEWFLWDDRVICRKKGPELD